MEISGLRAPTPNEGLLQGFRGNCQRCSAAVDEPALCAQCGVYGHQAYLNLEYFQGYPFCGTCLSVVIQQYAKYEDGLHREQWRRSLAEQIANWKQAATQAVGVSASVGVAIGGAAASAAGAAIALAHGVVQGARQGSTSPRSLTNGEPGVTPSGGQPSDGPPSGALEPPPEPAVEAPRRTAIRRSCSSGDLAVAGFCVACHTANPSHLPHLRSGNCVGFPGRSHFSALPTEQVPPLPPPHPTPRPTASRTDRSVIPDSRRASGGQPSDGFPGSPPQSFGSAAEEPSGAGPAAATVANAVTAAAATAAGDNPAQPLHPLESASANAENEAVRQQSGGTPFDRSQNRQNSQHPTETEPGSQHLSSIAQDLIGSMEGLTGAVRRLEARMGDIELEWGLWQSCEEGAAQQQAEQYRLDSGNTPREEQADLDDWYHTGEHPGQVEIQTVQNSSAAHGVLQPPLQALPQPIAWPSARVPLEDGRSNGVRVIPRREEDLTQAHGHELSEFQSGSFRGVQPIPHGQERSEQAISFQHLHGGLSQHQGISDIRSISFPGAGTARSGAVANCQPLNPNATGVGVNEGIGQYLQTHTGTPPGLYHTTPNTIDSDVFSFLAGAQRARPTEGLEVGTAEASTPQFPFVSSCVPSPHGPSGGLTATHSGAQGQDARVPAQPLTSGELGMLMKSIQAFVPEFPKLEMGDTASRANRLKSWRTAVTHAINPAGPHLIQWWTWCLHEADNSHEIFLKTPISQREGI